MPIFDPLSIFDPYHLHEAIKLGNIAFVKNVLKFGLNVMAILGNLDTALTLAARMRNSEIVKLLLDHGVDPADEDGDQQMAMLTAVESCDVAIINLLMQYGADITKVKNWQEIHIIAMSGDLAKMEKLIFQGVDLEERATGVSIGRGFFLDLTPLHCAAKAGNENMIKFLLEKGAKFDQICSGENKTSILHLAAEGGNVEIFKNFLDRGLNIHERDVQGNTVLHYAARGAHPSEIIKFLLRTKESKST